MMLLRTVAIVLAASCLMFYTFSMGQAKPNDGVEDGRVNNTSLNNGEGEGKNKDAFVRIDTLVLSDTLLLKTNEKAVIKKLVQKKSILSSARKQRDLDGHEDQLHTV